MRLSEQDKLDRLRLIRSPRVGPVTFRQMIERYGSAKQALLEMPKLARRGGERTPIKPATIAQASAEIERVKALRGKIIFWGEENYPQSLYVLADAPPVITVFGHAQLLLKASIAIVGTRNSSANAMRFTTKLAAECGQSEYVVVSGMARGIDTAANTAALPSGSIAVLAGGADNIYPYENRKLYHSLIERGAVVSEMPIGFAPTARYFPRRNRIIAGLAIGTVIVEASLKSGAMITARFALDQGREVFAVPGSPQDERSAGPNQLLRDGAYLVTSAADIIAVLNRRKDASERMQQRHQIQAALYENIRLEQQVENSGAKQAALAGENLLDDKEIDKLREKIFELISFDLTPIDELIRMLHSEPSHINAALLEMELAGRIERAAANCVVRSA